jgi:hypothetical protein
MNQMLFFPVMTHANSPTLNQKYEFLRRFDSLRECLEYISRDPRGIPYLTKIMREQLQAEMDEGYALCTETVSD